MSILTKIIMKELPILFSAPMIRAILDGRKTMTRRIVKSQFNTVWGSGCPNESTFTLMNGGQRWKDAFAVHVDRQTASGHWEWLFCPYGKPGDRLYVKETFYAWGRWVTRFDPKKQRDEWHFIDLTLESGKQYQYAEPEGYQKSQRGGVLPTWWKRPAIFMPRTASRITLEITGVRVERLQSIAEADALAEGIQALPGGGFGVNEPFSAENTACEAFRLLWDSINGKRASWESNAWCWVVEFNQLKTQ